MRDIPSCKCFAPWVFRGAVFMVGAFAVFVSYAWDPSWPTRVEVNILKSSNNSWIVHCLQPAKSNYKVSGIEIENKISQLYTDVSFNISNTTLFSVERESACLAVLADFFEKQNHLNQAHLDGTMWLTSNDKTWRFSGYLTYLCGVFRGLMCYAVNATSDSQIITRCRLQTLSPLSLDNSSSEKSGRLQQGRPGPSGSL